MILGPDDNDINYNLIIDYSSVQIWEQSKKVDLCRTIKIAPGCHTTQDFQKVLPCILPVESTNLAAVLTFWLDYGATYARSGQSFQHLGDAHQQQLIDLLTAAPSHKESH